MILIALLLALGPKPALACDRSRIGTLSEHVPAVYAEFEIVQTILRQVPLNDRPVVNSLRLVYEDTTRDSPIFIQSDTIFFNKSFVRLMTHSAIQDAYMLELEVLEMLVWRPEVLVGFRRDLIQRTFRDLEAFIFPQYIGLSHEECVSYWDSPDFISRVALLRSSNIQFWLLHEIAHVELGHAFERTVTRSDIWRREHEADIWAFQVFNDAFGPEMSIHLFSATSNTFANFDDNSYVLSEFTGSATHPPSFCRARRVYEYLQGSIRNRGDASVLLGRLADVWAVRNSEIIFEYGLRTGELSGAIDDYCIY